VALGARLRLVGPDGAREVPAEEFFTGAYETARGAVEVLTDITVPVPGPGTAVAYRRLAFLERPTAAVAAVLRRDAAGRIEDVRIVAGAVGPRPERARAAELALTGLGPDDVRAALGAAARLAAGAVSVIPDLHGSADYKRHLVEVHVRRAVGAALAALAAG
jgi:carbon-monoxide dehydrogenase medium subunit